MAKFNLSIFSRKKDLTTTGPDKRKRDVPEGLWLKCPSCAEIVYKQELSNNSCVCPKCEYHFQMDRRDRIDSLIDPGTFEEWDTELASVDILGFTGTDSYEAKLKKNREKTGEKDAITTGTGRMGGHAIGLGVMDFNFLGASMGVVVGEKVTRLIERSTAKGMPVILVCASGGARMYEGIFSLMQMAKTSGALARHTEAGLAYIPILTHPTMAGVMASFATLGDIIVAEPGALIGFAGPRVIKDTTQSELPPGFQRSEFLLEHGLIDKVINRRELKERLVEILGYLDPNGAVVTVVTPPSEPEPEADEPE
jgi:acetyl-CoA carboxylase carboxyl transferase subunit beta